MKKKTVAFALIACCIIGASTAAPLSRAYVSAVSSAKGGLESLNPGARGTSRDHGGAWMKIVTDEVGHGQHAQATLLGFNLREIRTEPLCNVGGLAKPCTGRGAIVGYRRTWDASGREEGNFQFRVFPIGIGSPIQVNFTVR